MPSARISNKARAAKATGGAVVGEGGAKCAVLCGRAGVQAREGESETMCIDTLLSASGWGGRLSAYTSPARTDTGSGGIARARARGHVLRLRCIDVLCDLCEAD